LTTFSRALVSVNDDIPMSYLPAERPVMIASNVTLTNLTFRPSLANSAAPRSTSIPTTVCPFEAMNSFGA
jgi:hypothetical protein